MSPAARKKKRNTAKCRGTEKDTEAKGEARRQKLHETRDYDVTVVITRPHGHLKDSDEQNLQEDIRKRFDLYS